MAFVQTQGNIGNYGTRKGQCHICNYKEEGHHGWEIKNKNKAGEIPNKKDDKY